MWLNDSVIDLHSFDTDFTEQTRSKLLSDFFLASSKIVGANCENEQRRKLMGMEDFSPGKLDRFLETAQG